MNTNDGEKLTAATYDPEYTGGYHCMNCGYITVHDLDLETEYLDLHCKCGGAVVRVPAEELLVGTDVFDVVGDGS